MLVGSHGLVERFSIIAAMFPSQPAVEVESLGLEFHCQLQDVLAALQLLTEIEEQFFNIEATLGDGQVGIEIDFAKSDFQSRHVPLFKLGKLR